MLDRSGHNLMRLRQARYKARLAAGISVWPVEVDEARYAPLVRLGYLDPRTTDARAGARAIEQLLDGIELEWLRKSIEA
jgi:hypothetical protein